MEYNKPAERISSIDMPMFDISTTVAVSSDQEIVSARRQGRALAELMGFSASDATLIATTISELARNIVHYAKSGKILLGKINGGEKAGIVVIAQDPGPGISDMQLAVRDGYSTSGGLGLGLPGVKRIMDVFEIVSRLGSGTTVTTIKWKR
jgi:serine/threonine-protein kinase RsbT